MPTLAELMDGFDKTASAPTGTPAPKGADASLTAALESGTTKAASTGGNSMTLQDIYLKMSDMDQEKTAAAGAPATGEPTEQELRDAAVKLAAAEADTQLAGGAATETPAVEQTEEEIMKVAAEYDSAGRIMARGFFDEFHKLAASVATQAAPNQHTESESAAKTPALGERGLPTVETNFAGSPNHDQGMSTKGGKEVYKDSLKSPKKIKAGVTGDNPEAAATSLGGGAPAGFATVRDLVG